MLTRAAAPKVIACDKHFSTLRAQLVQDEIRIRAALRIVAPIEEEVSVKPFFADGLKETRRDDLIRVDIIDRQRNNPAFEGGELFHFETSRVLTSVTRPVMALAAAVSGLAKNVRPPLPWRPSKLRLLVETLYSPGAS